MAVVGAHQVRLRSSAHSPDMLDGLNGHGGNSSIWQLAVSNWQIAKPSPRMNTDLHGI
jgi:hypothetical protein